MLLSILSDQEEFTTPLESPKTSRRSNLTILLKTRKGRFAFRNLAIHLSVNFPHRIMIYENFCNSGPWKTGDLTARTIT